MAKAVSQRKRVSVPSVPCAMASPLLHLLVEDIMLNLYLNFYLRHQRAAATTCLLLGVFYAAGILCIDVIFTESTPNAARLLFVGCMLMGAVLSLVSLFRARRGSGLWLPAHLCSMIGFGMGTGLAAGTTGAIACAMAAINGMCALAVLLLRVEQDS